MKRYIKSSYATTQGNPDLVDVAIEKNWQGYYLVGTDESGRHWYVSKVRRDGTYEWCSDYLYAKYFKTEQVAQKHLDDIYF